MPFSGNFHRYENYREFLSNVDAVYVLSSPEKRYSYAKTAIEHKKHVLSETPVAMTRTEAAQLYTWHMKIM